MEYLEDKDFKIIDLNWKNHRVASLLKYGTQYFYRLHSDEVTLAKMDGCPSVFLTEEEFLLSDEYFEINKIPTIFSDFLVNKNRKDLCEALDIKQNDDSFTVLFKVAGSSEQFSKDAFWISEGKEKLKRQLISHYPNNR